MISGVKIGETRSATKSRREATERAPAQLRNGLQVLVRRERAAIRDDVGVDVKLPDHPFFWSLNPEKQQKARRWWFKAIRLGKVRTDGKRYIRSGAILRAWKLVSNFNDFDGLITLSNPAPGAEWVVGEKQVPSHEKSGHPRIDKVAMRSRQRMNAKARVLWQTIAHPESLR